MKQQIEQLVRDRDRLMSAFERARLAANDVMGDLTEFDEAALFENDQAIVKQNGYLGVIDEFGKVIIPCNFDEIDRLVNKNFYLVKLNEKYGLYNNEGQKILNTKL